jgi:hypothetical protein
MNMTRRMFQVGGLAVAGVGVLGCSSNRNYVYRQKLTIVVRTPDGDKTGSAVTEVKVNVGKQGYLSASIVGYKVSGEAPVVDLGKGRYLFGLLSLGGPYTATEWLAYHTFWQKLTGDFPGSEESYNALFSKLVTSRISAPLPREDYPLLVTFRDLNDPLSVQELKPQNFAEVLGSGYGLNSITLEITDDEVTKNEVIKHLPWLPNYFDKQLDGDTVRTVDAKNRLANSIDSHSFTTWR